jgi:hypothetical protein
MTVEPKRFSEDPFDCRGALRSALSDRDREAGGAAGKRAAYRMVVALGRCRLFGVAPAEDGGGPPPADTAARAATELADLLDVWTAEALHLEESWESARDPAEADDLCAGLLAAHIDARAALLVIEDVLGAAGCTAVVARLSAFERALRGRREAELLSTVVGTRLFDNWRSCLSGAFQGRFFRWIDELEETARRIEEESARTMPGSSAWDALRRAVAFVSSGEPMLASFAALGVDALADAPMDDAELDLEPEPAILCWVSPDGQYRAELCLPDQEPPEDDAIAAPLNFSSRRSGRMVGGPDWTGKPVWLAGAPSAIDEHGQARFVFANLRQAPLRLIVGDGGEVWQFQPQGDEP